MLNRLTICSLQQLVPYCRPFPCKDCRWIELVPYNLPLFCKDYMWKEHSLLIICTIPFNRPQLHLYLAECPLKAVCQEVLADAMKYLSHKQEKEK